MEDLDDTVSTSNFDHLFIKEEEDDPDKTLMEQKECSMAQSGLAYSGTHLSQSGFIKPYLQEMDDLLKNCEELTASPFRSPFSASYNETTLIESTKSQSKEKDAMKSIEEKNISPQGYLVTSYIDTHMDGERTEDREAHRQSQGLCAIKNRCGVGADLSCQKEMPLTSVGCKLSDTMVEYEGRLLGMLAMLENCMEEAGMDYETQDWDNDASQEYVHISKNPHLSRGPTLVPTQQEGSNKLKAQRMQTESWTGQNAGGDHLSKEGRNEGTVATNGRQQNPVASCENILGFSIERLEKHGNLTTNEGVLDPHSCFSNPSKPLDAENDPTQSEVLNTGYISTNEGKNARRDKTGMQVLNPELPAVGEKDPKMEVSDLGSGISDLVTLGAQMEDCIEEVQCLEKRRRELLAEVLELRGNEDRQVAEGSYKDTEESIDSKVVEVMIALKREEEGRREERKREIQGLREERSEEERRMWKVNLERQGLQEELRKLKRRLFTMARDCAHNQFALSNQQREVDLLKKEEVTNSIQMFINLFKTPTKKSLFPSCRKSCILWCASRQKRSPNSTQPTNNSSQTCRHSITPKPPVTVPTPRMS